MNILYSLTNCVSAPALPLPSSIAVLIAVVVPAPVLLPASASASVLAPVSIPASSSSLFLSSSSSSSCELSVVGPQPDSPLSLFQPLSLPSPPASGATCLALQAVHRVQKWEKCKQN